MWNIRTLGLLCLMILFAASVRPQDTVRDADVAVKIAEKALIRGYGKHRIEAERPFSAKLEGDVWIVTGTLHCKDSQDNDTQHCFGGVAQARVSRVNGHVLSFTHTK